MENVDENEVVVPVNLKEIIQLDEVIKHLSRTDGRAVKVKLQKSRVFLWCLKKVF